MFNIIVIILSLINIFILLPLFVYLHNKYIKQVMTIPLFVFLMLILVYPIRGLIIYYDNNHAIIPNLYSFNDIIFFNLLLYANLAIILFFVGSLLVFAINIKPLNYFGKINYLKLYKKTYIFNIFLFFIVYFFSLKMQFELRQFGNVKESILSGRNIYYSLFLSLKIYILIFFAFFYFNYNKGKYIFYIIFILLIIEALFSGSKSNFLILLIIIILLYKYGKIKFFYFIIGFILLLLVSTVASIVRFFIVHNLNANFIDVFLFVFSNLNYNFFMQAVNTLTHRFHGMDSLYDIYFYIKNNDYLYGKSLFYFFYAFYPRILWQDKPDIAMGIWFGNNVFEIKDTTVAFWLPGETFLNFGYGGLLLMFLYGMWLAFLDKKLHNNVNLFMMMIYISVFLTIKTHEYSMAAAMSGIIKNLIPVIVYILLLKFFYKIKI